MWAAIGDEAEQCSAGLGRGVAGHGPGGAMGRDGLSSHRWGAGDADGGRCGGGEGECGGAGGRCGHCWRLMGGWAASAYAPHCGGDVPLDAPLLQLIGVRARRTSGLAVASSARAGGSGESVGAGSLSRGARGEAHVLCWPAGRTGDARVTP
jgi:hypothetical protein